MRKPTVFPVSRFLLAALLCTLGIGSRAADAPSAAPPASASTTAPVAPEISKRRIEDITVTANRTESAAQDTPIAISAFTGETIEKFGLRNQTDLQNLVPSTTIQPYDSAVRGVGRNFRNLGGDPGVATYMNGVYSEDLYTATIGSYWDMERIEVLRGPQGTLYGRNAVGGAMNFIYNKPTDKLEARVKTVLGNFNAREIYGMVNVPIWQDRLDARLAISKRKHDGYVNEIGRGQDLDSGDEGNLALSLRIRPIDRVEINFRNNEARVDRIMGGADGGGLIALYGEAFGGKSRDYKNIVFGYRQINRAQSDSTANDFFDARNPVYSFRNPSTGASIEAQNLRPGIDSAQLDGLNNKGRGLTLSPTKCLFKNRKNIKGSDECAQTNGFNSEKFDQHGSQTDITFAATDNLRFKYIYGFNDLSYQRITDDDSTFSTQHDRQFYVNHEATYTSNEFQAFYEPLKNVTVTSGIFFYGAKINQRGDFYSSVNDPQFSQPATDFGIAEAIFGTPDMVGLYSARTQAGGDKAAKGVFGVALGPWLGDPGNTRLHHGPRTSATDLEYGTRTHRDAFAAYTQGVWTINPEFALTVGVRYAEDKLEGEENLFRYTELPLTNVSDPEGLPSLADFNVLRGALDPDTLQPTGAVPVYTTGIPFSLSVFRKLRRTDQKYTGRINLDWRPNDTTLVYGSVTTGYRAGGFNLVFFSTTATYNPEKLIAYELGLKGTYLDGTLQVDASAFLYDYSTIHTFGTEVSLAGGTTTSVLEAPGARITGLEADVVWLPTEHLTLGGNVSFTPSEYTKSLRLADGADPNTPDKLFNGTDRLENIKGNQLLQVPDYKGAAYASYEFNLGEYGKLIATGTYSLISSVYFSPFQAKVEKAPGYDRFDARLTWTSTDDKWTASAFVDNVFDKVSIRQILINGQETGFNRTAQLTEPRLIGIEAAYTFGK